MSVSKIFSAQPELLSASIVTIDADLSKGLYAFNIVGLASKAVDEAKDRVSAAVKNTGWKSPKQSNQKIVISLAPADVRKDGSGFDVPMALAYLLAAEHIDFDPKGKLFVGELSLDGSVQAVNGVLPIVRAAKAKGFTECFVPKDNAREAALIEDIAIYPTESLADVVAHINTRRKHVDDFYLEPKKIPRQKSTRVVPTGPVSEVDMADVKGQFAAKRALEIALSGGHNIVLWGPAGTGKTMLAKAAVSLVPELSFEDMLDVSSIYSVYGGARGLITHPPFRAPHHTASYVSIIGGGANVRPGEVTLAHKGILFLDELAEFSPQVLETLREPLEEGKVRISRARGTAQYPADFLLIGAMNPCPCGNFGVAGRTCICRPIIIEKYRRKLSGPIADRIDLWVEVSLVEHKKLSGKNTLTEETSDTVKKRINSAREMQKARYKTEKFETNSKINAAKMQTYMPLDSECKNILDTSAKKLNLSARSYHRIIKTSRTIADLAGAERIEPTHIFEALQYRARAY